MATSISPLIGPPYIDTFAEENQRLDDSAKKTLLVAKWDNVHKFNFPNRNVGGRFRKIQSHWFITNSWLRYSMKKEGVYCAPCHLFGGKDVTSKNRSLSAVPISDPSNIGKIIKSHELSALHSASCEAAHNFIAVCDGKMRDITSSLSSAHEELVEKNRNILMAIVDTLILCGKQNIAIRGREEERSNFAALLTLQAKNNPVLQDHLEHDNPRTKYTSPTVQNEIISICGDMITKKLVDACNSAPFFGFIADEATDAATMEQMALVLRYYDRRRSKMCEDFLGFATCEATTGEVLAEAFLSNLRDAGVNVQSMRGQGYDGAANMSGRHRGVQARIRQVVPGALYTHCKAHCLNLAIVHASREQYARNMMSTVQEVAFLFDYSAKRLLKFQQNIENNVENREEMTRRTKLQTLCETRWAARADALFTFKAAFETVVTTLEMLATGSDAKAGAFKAAITQFSFIISLVAVEHVLSSCVQLSKQLQSAACDLIQASVEARVVIAQVEAERNDELVWEALFEKATSMAESVGVEPSVPRQARQQHRPNAPADNTSQYWRVNMYLPFVDHLITELQARLIQDNERYVIQYLLPHRIRDLGVEQMNAIYTATHEDLPGVEQETFVRECQRWKTRCAETEVTASTSIESVLQGLPDDLYPNVDRCLHLLLVMPVSTASAERSFSTMRRLKTYLRATMTTERLSGLGLMSIHRDMELRAEAVVDTFAQRKTRRLALVFND